MQPATLKCNCKNVLFRVAYSNNRGEQGIWEFNRVNVNSTPLKSLLYDLKARYYYPIRTVEAITFTLNQCT